jgi:hypothetical protein
MTALNIRNEGRLIQCHEREKWTTESEGIETRLQRDSQRLLIYVILQVLKFQAMGRHRILSNGATCGILGGGGSVYDRGSGVRFPAGAGNFSLHHRVQNGSGAHRASYPRGTRGLFPGVKRPGREADHSPPSSAEVKEWVELYLHSPNTPSWRGA